MPELWALLLRRRESKGEGRGWRAKRRKGRASPLFPLPSPLFSFPLPRPEPVHRLVVFKKKKILLRRYYYYGQKISINRAFLIQNMMHNIIIKKLKNCAWASFAITHLGARSLNSRRQENPTTNSSSSILSDYCCKEVISIH